MRVGGEVEVRPPGMYGLELLGDGAGRQRRPRPLQVGGESGGDDGRGVRGSTAG